MYKIVTYLMYNICYKKGKSRFKVKAQLLGEKKLLIKEFLEAQLRGINNYRFSLSFPLVGNLSQRDSGQARMT